MKASVTVVGSAVVGIAGVLGLHSGKASTSSTPLALAKGPSATTSTTAPGANSASTTTTVAGSTSPAAATTGVRTAVGKSENYGYGNLSVKVTINGSKITDVGISQIQTMESYSQSIAQQVAPILKSEVLSLQGWRINLVSGATYTTEAYAYSLQSALNQLHFK